MSAQCEPESSVVPWDGISLGVGRTRRFLKMTHQPPKLLCTSDGSSVNQSLPPQARQTGLCGLAPPPAPVLLLLCTFLPLPGPTPSLVRGGGEGFVFLSNCLASFLLTQCKTLPLPPSWPTGRLPSTRTSCFTATVWPCPPSQTHAACHAWVGTEHVDQLSCPACSRVYGSQSLWLLSTYNSPKTRTLVPSSPPPPVLPAQIPLFPHGPVPQC